MILIVFLAFGLLGFLCALALGLGLCLAAARGDEQASELEALAPLEATWVLPAVEPRRALGVRREQ